MESSRIRVKMCGMTRTEDIAHAVRLGVDAIGLIFYAKSARNVSLEQVKLLLKDLPPFVTPVAVLVNPDKDFVDALINSVPVKLLQFHGDETPQFCQQFNMPYIKTIHPESSAQIKRQCEEFTQAQALLLDACSSTQRGGTGLTFDWQIIPKELSKPYVLAGGLNESNINDALKVCTPYALDVCSGIETTPGIKDHLKMSRFMQALQDIK